MEPTDDTQLTNTPVETLSGGNMNARMYRAHAAWIGALGKR